MMYPWHTELYKSLHNRESVVMGVIRGEGGAEKSITTFASFKSLLAVLTTWSKPYMAGP
jgi:hypothetical protein